MTDERSPEAGRSGDGDRADADPTSRDQRAGPQPRSDAPRGGHQGAGTEDRRPRDGGSGGERPRGGRPHGGRPSGGNPTGGRPYGSKPPGRGYGDRQGPRRGYPDRSQGGRPYAGKPGGRPYGGGPQGRPYSDRPGGGPPGGGRAVQGRPAGEGDDRPRFAGPYEARRQGGPRGERGADRSQGGGRRVEYGRVERGGPRPPRGAWDRDRAARQRGEWDRGDRPDMSPSLGPPPADVLAEDEEIVAGRRPVEEAFAARREAKRMLVVPGRRAALEQLVLHATTLRIPVVEVEGGTITSVAGFDGHQGVALVVAPRQWASLDDVLALARSRGEPPFVLALDHLEDPQNVGTLLRSAEACGVHGVIFPTQGAAPISPAAIKTSAGAVEHLLLVPMSDLASGLVDLHARGLRVIGADGDASMTVREVDMRGPIVIVTGSEGRGLHARVRRRVDVMARIPMRGKVASLNASVAGSVFLFEAAAQRDLPEAERPAQPVDLGPEESVQAPGRDLSESVAPATSASPATSADRDVPAESFAPPQPASPEAEPDGQSAVDPEDLLPEAPSR